MGVEFFRNHTDNNKSIGEHIVDCVYIPDGRKVILTCQANAATVKRVNPPPTDMFSHPPYVQFVAEDSKADETRDFRQFVDKLVELKPGASPRLRAYIFRLIIDERVCEEFFDDPRTVLEGSNLDRTEKDALWALVSSEREKEKLVKKFKEERERVIDDGDHFLLFPQNLETIAPKSWLTAAWSFIEHFRSNFGFYLGEAMLYSRVTIIGSADAAVSVSKDQEDFLKRQDWRQVERINITSANDLKAELDRRVASSQQFVGNDTPA